MQPSASIPTHRDPQSRNVLTARSAPIPGPILTSASASASPARIPSPSSAPAASAAGALSPPAAKRPKTELAQRQARLPVALPVYTRDAKAEASRDTSGRIASAAAWTSAAEPGLAADGSRPGDSAHALRDQFMRLIRTEKWFSLAEAMQDLAGRPSEVRVRGLEALMDIRQTLSGASASGASSSSSSSASASFAESEAAHQLVEGLDSVLDLLARGRARVAAAPPWEDIDPPAEAPQLREADQASVWRENIADAREAEVLCAYYRLLFANALEPRPGSDWQHMSLRLLPALNAAAQSVEAFARHSKVWRGPTMGPLTPCWMARVAFENGEGGITARLVNALDTTRVVNISNSILASLQSLPAADVKRLLWDARPPPANWALHLLKLSPIAQGGKRFVEALENPDLSSNVYHWLRRAEPAQVNAKMPELVRTFDTHGAVMWDAVLDGIVDAGIEPLSLLTDMILKLPHLGTGWKLDYLMGVLLHSIKPAPNAEGQVQMTRESGTLHRSPPMAGTAQSNRTLRTLLAAVGQPRRQADGRLVSDRQLLPSVAASVIRYLRRFDIYQSQEEASSHSRYLPMWEHFAGLMREAIPDLHDADLVTLEACHRATMATDPAKPTVGSLPGNFPAWPDLFYSTSWSTAPGTLGQKRLSSSAFLQVHGVSLRQALSEPERSSGEGPGMTALRALHDFLQAPIPQPFFHRAGEPWEPARIAREALTQLSARLALLEPTLDASAAAADSPLRKRARTIEERLTRIAGAGAL